jgi:hypothetical protein
LGIAALDLELIGRRYPHIAALPRLPQWLDHMAFGALLGAMLGRPASPDVRNRRVHNRHAHNRPVHSEAAAASRHQVPAIPYAC